MNLEEKQVKREKHYNLGELPGRIVDSFFDTFLRENKRDIEAKNYGIVGQNLESEVDYLLKMAEKYEYETGRDAGKKEEEKLSNILARKILAGIDLYKKLPDETIKKAREYLDKYTVPWRNKIYSS